MKVFYKFYELTPLKAPNRLETMKAKTGVFLKGVLGQKTLFADYFPHLPLGDRSNDEFLEQFKFQDFEYDQKVFDLLLRDEKFQNLKEKKFFNHELWSGLTEPQASVLKYKIKDQDDFTFLKCLQQGLKVRLDANGLFTRNDFFIFLEQVPSKYYPLIEYIEDPLTETDWNDLKLKTAKDFIEGNPSDFSIYKPNCEFLPKTDAPIIYSSYLGSDFGRWHAYCDLVETGDLSLTHGIITSGFYQEEKAIFTGTYRDGWNPNKKTIRSLYQDLTQSDWKLLCSM